MNKQSSWKGFVLLITALFLVGGFFVANVVQASTDQTISFGALSDKTYGNSDFNLNATATSRLSVELDSLTSLVCIVGGVPDVRFVRIVTAGTCTVRASQGGDVNYNAAPDVDQSFTVTKADANISIAAYSELYDGVAHGASIFTAMGVLGDDLSHSVNLGDSFTNFWGGTAYWTFTNANYNDQSGGVGINIAQVLLTVTADTKSKFYGASDPVFTFTQSELIGAESLTGVTCGVSGTHVNVGTYPIVCSGNTNANYSSTYVDGTLTVDKANTVTLITCPASETYTGSALTPCTVVVTGGLSLTPAADYTANIDVGTATASYTFAGDANHTGSTDTKTFAITVVQSSGGGGYNTLPPTTPTTPVVPAGQVLGASTGPIGGCGNRTTGFSTATGQSCVGNTETNNSEGGQVLGASSFHFSLLMRNGSNGNEILELQKFLNNLGHSCGTADGKFGPKTKSCVVKFQLSNKLKGDGVVGALTRAFLNQ